MHALTAFLEAAVRFGTPLLLAAIGELLVERSGIINIGLEGIILGGAFGSVVGAAQGSVALGVLGGVAGGMVFALVMAALVVWLEADQIVAGTAITLLSLGVTGTWYRLAFGATGSALSLPTLTAIRIPLFASIPVIGPAFFDQPVFTYIAYVVVPVVWWWLSRTHDGLALRASGEAPDVVRATGRNPARLQLLALGVEGVLGGLAGATLVLAQTGTFAEGMSAGRGFIAIAVVVLGRWSPWGVALAALIFGAASALQYLLQAFGFALPYQFFLALPFVLTLVALAGIAGRVRAPAALGRLGATE